MSISEDHKALSKRKLTPKIADSLTEIIGNTPLLRLNKFAAGAQAEIVAKLERQNPWGSVKDRIGLYMIEEAERQGIIIKTRLL